MKRTFYRRIKNGRLIDNERLISGFLKGRRDGECTVIVLTGVDATDPKRTTRQNRYYWGVVVQRYLDAAIDTGDTMIEDVRRELRAETLKDALHELLLYRFAGCEVIDRDTGEIMRLPGRSSKMNTKEISVFWDKVRDDALEKYGIEIPSPPSDFDNDAIWDEFSKKHGI